MVISLVMLKSIIQNHLNVENIAAAIVKKSEFYKFFKKISSLKIPSMSIIHHIWYKVNLPFWWIRDVVSHSVHACVKIVTVIKLLMCFSGRPEYCSWVSFPIWYSCHKIDVFHMLIPMMLYHHYISVSSDSMTVFVPFLTNSNSIFTIICISFCPYWCNIITMELSTH